MEENDPLLTREVKWDFLRYYLGHSVIMLILVGINLWQIERGITYKIWIGFATVFGAISMFGYYFAKQKRIINIPSILFKFGALILVGIGGSCICTKKDFNIFKLLVFVIIIPSFIQMLASYLKRVKESFGEITIETPLCTVFLLINWVSAFLFMYWSNSLQESYINIIFEWIYTVFTIILISGMVWEIKVIYEKRLKVCKY